LIAAGTLLILFSIFIAPEFHDILRDFGMQLPTLTLAVFAVTDLISAIWWLLPAAVIGFPMVILSGVTRQQEKSPCRVTGLTIN
jgi:type II secretory pathway component PulF